MRLVGLVVALALAVIPAPLAVVGQEATRIARIGVLGPTPVVPSNDEAFKQGLAQFGYVHGRNLVIEYRDGEGARLSELAADLVRLKVEVIYARGPAAVTASRNATRTVSVVAIDLESDPVAVGFARGLAQPGGNITGVFLDLPELSGKQLQLLKEVIPKLSRVGVLGDSVLNAPQLRATEVAAQTLKLDLQSRGVRTAVDFAIALETLKKGRVGAAVILSSPLVYDQRAQISALAVEKRIPAMSMFVEFAEAGGLMAYGPSIRDASRRCGAYVGKILQGAYPGDLPIERPERFELAINLKTAKALGLTIPQAVLGRADQVIE
jgi:putative ABC transport system substrate-binding protein